MNPYILALDNSLKHNRTIRKKSKIKDQRSPPIAGALFGAWSYHFFVGAHIPDSIEDREINYIKEAEMMPLKKKYGGINIQYKKLKSKLKLKIWLKPTRNVQQCFDKVCTVFSPETIINSFQRGLSLFITSFRSKRYNRALVIGSDMQRIGCYHIFIAPYCSQP